MSVNEYDSTCYFFFARLRCLYLGVLENDRPVCMHDCINVRMYKNWKTTLFILTKKLKQDSECLLRFYALTKRFEGCKKRQI